MPPIDIDSRLISVPTTNDLKLADFADLFDDA